jgi:hypothetical protein
MVARSAAEFRRGRRTVGFEEGTEQAAVELGVEVGDADSLGRERVAIGTRGTLDEVVEAEAAQVVAHLRGAVVPAEESGDMPAKALVGEASDGVDEDAESTGQSYGAKIPEAEGSGSLALLVVGLVDALEERGADVTALAGTFDDKQTVVDLAGLGDELGEVLEAGSGAEIRRLADNGLDAQGPPFFEVLLDAAVLVGEGKLDLGVPCAKMRVR